MLHAAREYLFGSSAAPEAAPEAPPEAKKRRGGAAPVSLMRLPDDALVDACARSTSSRRPRAMSDAFPTDVIVEVLACLDVEGVLQVGCSNTSLRETTLLERVWTPRLATCGLGRFPLEAEALASLAHLGGDARRLCLQCLPWRPRRGAASDADDDSDMWQTSWSWRPDWMPKQLHQPGTSQDFIFVEVYETNVDNSSADGRRPEHYRVALPEVEDSKTFIMRSYGAKIIPLDACCVWNFPEEVSVPLNVDLSADDAVLDRVFDIRVFMQLDGILSPIADTCCMEGEENCRSHESMSFADKDHRLMVTVNMDNDWLPSWHFKSFDLSWKLLDGDWDEIEQHTLGERKHGLGKFHEYNAARVISTLEDGHAHRYSFACDYERWSGNQALFDFSRKKPGNHAALGPTHEAIRAAETKVARALDALETAKLELVNTRGRAELGPKFE
jgi:hypothetical protein